MSISKFLFFSAIFTTLTGCASTGIVKSGDDRYVVSKMSMKPGFGAPTAVYAEITGEAQEFCQQQNKDMEIVNSDLKLPAVGRPGTATLEFRCRAK